MKMQRCGGSRISTDGYIPAIAGNIRELPSNLTCVHHRSKRMEEGRSSTLRFRKDVIQHVLQQRARTLDETLTLPVHLVVNSDGLAGLEQSAPSADAAQRDVDAAHLRHLQLSMDSPVDSATESESRLDWPRIYAFLASIVVGDPITQQHHLSAMNLESKAIVVRITDAAFREAAADAAAVAAVADSTTFTDQGREYEQSNLKSM